MVKTKMCMQRTSSPLGLQVRSYGEGMMISDTHLHEFVLEVVSICQIPSSSALVVTASIAYSTPSQQMLQRKCMTSLHITMLATATMHTAHLKQHFNIQACMIDQTRSAAADACHVTKQ